MMDDTVLLKLNLAHGASVVLVAGSEVLWSLTCLCLVMTQSSHSLSLLELPHFLVLHIWV